MGIKNNYKHICIVTSALGSPIGHVNLEDRYTQTLHSINTIREKIPDCCIVFSDISCLNVDNYKDTIKSLVDVFLDFSDNTQLIDLSNKGFKSHADLIKVRNSLEFIKNYIDLTHIDRIFKLSGRHSITHEFNILEYKNYKNKYVFKTPVKSWISSDMFLYEARLFSIPVSKLEDYIQKWPDMINSCDGTFDLEHTYYKWLNKDDVITVDNIWVEGIVAGNGRYQKD